MPFDYDNDKIQAIEAALSPERFQKYLTSTKGSRVNALRLYERNTALSEGLYGVIQATEVAMRNSMNGLLVAQVGLNWFDVINLDPAEASKIVDAKKALAGINRPISNGRIVAGLSLGFWTGLISARNEKKLWVPYLHRSFPHAMHKLKNRKGNEVNRPMNRLEIMQKLEIVRTMRNRIAHHEPIFHLNLWDAYIDTLRVLRWICPISADWASHTNCFRTRFHEKDATHEPGRPALQQNVRPTPGKPVQQ